TSHRRSSTTSRKPPLPNPAGNRRKGCRSAPDQLCRDCRCQVVPSSVVAHTSRSSAAQPCSRSKNLTPRRPDVTPDTCQHQVFPPSAVTTIIPAEPTAAVISIDERQRVNAGPPSPHAHTDLVLKRIAHVRPASAVERMEPA